MFSKDVLRLCIQILVRKRPLVCEFKIFMEQTLKDFHFQLKTYCPCTSVYISREHGRLRTTRHFVSLVLVSFTLIYKAACPLLVKHSTINLSLTSEESLRDSKPPVTGYPRTKGQESVYETCACVIHTILLSYMCISIVSHFTLMFARGTCAL